jgi:hypothetical protein
MDECTRHGDVWIDSSHDNAESESESESEDDSSDEVAPTAAGTYSIGIWLPPADGVWLPACTGDEPDETVWRCDESTTCSDAPDETNSGQVTSGLTETSVCVGDIASTTSKMWTCPTAACPTKYTSVNYPATTDCTGTSTLGGWQLKTKTDALLKGECILHDATSLQPDGATYPAGGIKFKLADSDAAALLFPTCTVYEGPCTTDDKATSGAAAPCTTDDKATSGAAAAALALAAAAVALVSLTVPLL